MEGVTALIKPTPVPQKYGMLVEKEKGMLDR
jgi:hypothetical protein